MEYRRRCKVCGTIWCYTDKDLKSDAVNGVVGALNAIGGIASAFGGTVFHQKMFSDRMENDRRRQVNREQCPNCRSLYTEYYFGEDELDEEEAAPVAESTTYSNALAENHLTREQNVWGEGSATTCPNCNHTIAQNDTFCIYCGKVVVTKNNIGEETIENLVSRRAETMERINAANAEMLELEQQEQQLLVQNENLARQEEALQQAEANLSRKKDELQQKQVAFRQKAERIGFHAE